LTKGLGCLEITFIVLVTIISLGRIFTLASHPSALVNLEEFPSACSDWAVEGCTRITFSTEESEQGCLRPLEIPETYSIVFKYQADFVDKIEECVGQIGGAKINYDNLKTTDEVKLHYFAHATVITSLFGFIDDFYLDAKSETSDTVRVFTQSQLRIGQKDLEKNYKNIYSFYGCLQNDSGLQVADSPTKACSLSN